MEEFVIASARSLQLNGFEVTLVCSMTPEFEMRYSKEFQCVNIPMERGADFFGMLRSIRHLYRLFTSRAYGIVQYSTPNAALYAAVASFLAGSRIRLYGQWGLRYVGFTGVKRFLFKNIEKVTCMLSTHIRPVSIKNLDFAVSEGLYSKNKAKVLGSGGTIGIDLSRFNPKDKESDREIVLLEYPILRGSTVFGYVGRVARDKGFNELVCAFKQLSAGNSNVRLLVLGSYDQREDPVDTELLAWAFSSPCVVMAGHVNSAKYMSVMDVVVHPSYREGFSMVLQQAQALGIAVVTTDIPGPSEVVEPNVTGILVPPRDVVSLLQAMEMLLLNSDFRKQLGLHGQQRVSDLFERNLMLGRILEDRLSLLK
jgi:glycosyltransferase involved in cell wall biosynthesis